MGVYGGLAQWAVERPLQEHTVCVSLQTVVFRSVFVSLGVCAAGSLTHVNTLSPVQVLCVFVRSCPNRTEPNHAAPVLLCLQCGSALYSAVNRRDCYGFDAGLWEAHKQQNKGGQWIWVWVHTFISYLCCILRICAVWVWIHMFSCDFHIIFMIHSSYICCDCLCVLFVLCSKKCHLILI